MKKLILSSVLALTVATVFSSCQSTENNSKKTTSITASEILGNPDYQAISYGGYRQTSRDIQPSLAELKEDMKILSAMGIKIVRTYNVQLDHAPNLLQAIKELKEQDPNFEMYVMLGAWIDCLNAWTDLPPNHEEESPQNAGEIQRAVDLVNKYPEIVKVIAVGNEAMVRWAESYYVQPSVILKWVNHLQGLKEEGKLPSDLWITSSDDFASWGGEDASYHTTDLEQLYAAVDYISMHTYPYHNTHYNPEFWREEESVLDLSNEARVQDAMTRARDFAISQYDSVRIYMKSLGINKPIHIGETGWATISDGFYGAEGSRATDEYKQGLYFKLMREWTNKAGISCFYFEAFDEQWKDSANPMGSENHFGLIDLEGHAKYPLWSEVDAGTFDELSRNGRSITKSYDGDLSKLMENVLPPPTKPQVDEF